MSRDVVHAAGGVISRWTERGEVEVLLVHRPHRLDWTFPKGKVDTGETDEACALREVEEETGLRCALLRELPETSHIDHKGRRKVVRYWVMDSIGGVAGPRNEVDAVRWFTLSEAAATLTYERDRTLLKAFSAVLAAGSLRANRSATPAVHSRQLFVVMPSPEVRAGDIRLQPLARTLTDPGSV